MVFFGFEQRNNLGVFPHLADNIIRQRKVKKLSYRIKCKMSEVIEVNITKAIWAETS